MNTDSEILKQQSKALGAEVRKVIEVYLDLLGWISLFTMLGDVAMKRKDGKVTGILIHVVNFLEQKG